MPEPDVARYAIRPRGGCEIRSGPRRSSARSSFSLIRAVRLTVLWCAAEPECQHPGADAPRVFLQAREESGPAILRSDSGARCARAFPAARLRPLAMGVRGGPGFRADGLRRAVLQFFR